jgi:hypothetical protein
MLTNKTSEPRCARRRRAAVGTWMTLLICLSAGCGKRIEYVNGDHKLTRLKEGQPAPRPGVLISEGYLSEIYETLGQPKGRADILDSKAAPAASNATNTLDSSVAFPKR